MNSSTVAVYLLPYFVLIILYYFEKFWKKSFKKYILNKLNKLLKKYLNIFNFVF